ncbi:RNase H family protein [Kutzneria buriramensis]|uniref:Ribonuclease HI n=1 Tax=Kutzneria buriramensis TaxID=1045776 RepID=A0A3E0GY00_9PSEU|nr:RNase H family protein [Kutzneria buriramensis]REH30724.1 ribonuclease HI [Kutzneria buriramensis]
MKVYTGGACDGDPGPGGWGVLLRSGRHQKTLHHSAATTTLSRMELTAFVHALECLKKPSQVRLHSASAYLRDVLTKDPGRPDQESRRNADLMRRLGNCADLHVLSWQSTTDGVDAAYLEWINRVALKEMLAQAASKATTRAQAPKPASTPVPDLDKECRHGMKVAYCANCKQPMAGVLPNGYRTKGGTTYHNDPDCYWLRWGQTQAHRQGKNLRDIVSIAWSNVVPGELEPCEFCCTVHWLLGSGRVRQISW